MSPAEWVRCRDWILPALRDRTEAQLVEMLSANRAQLWGGEGAAIVTQLVRAEEPLLTFWLAGGGLPSVVAMVPGIEAWARAQGCAAVWIDGRKGWRRVLAAHGYVAADNHLRKVL